MRQQKFIFFDPTKDRKYKNAPIAPSDDEIRAMLASDKCPLNRIIVSEENQNNFNSLQLMCFSIIKKWDRNPRGNNFGLYCPPGQGKTFIMKCIAETLGIVFIFVQSASIDNTFTLFELIRNECEKQGVPLVAHKKRADFLLPPMLLFFDEAHKIPNSMTKGGLLNAMEPDDGIMAVRETGKSGRIFTVDCYNVCWSAATTERGDLFDAFEMRLLNPVQWHPATEKELPRMIKAGLDSKFRNGELNIQAPIEACEIMAKYQKVPRLAIHRFGTKAVQQKEYNPTDSWETVCKKIATMFGLDEFGLTKNQISILSALGQRPIAEGRLGNICGCRAKEIQKYELPGLQQYYEGGPFINSVSGKGMAITQSGLLQLEKRGIEHNGERITAEHFENKR